MKNKIIEKLNNYFKDGNYKEAIYYGETKLKEIKDKDLINKINLKLGLIFDQYALSFDNKGKEIIQNKALKCLKKGCKLDKFKCFRGIALIYHHQNKLNKALKYYKKAHKIKPENIKDYYNSLANIYQRMGLSKNKRKYLLLAKDYYKKSLDLSEDEDLTLIPIANLAILNNHLNNIKESKKYANKALNILNKSKKTYTKKDMEKTLKEILNEQ
jgi:tetratricopeptide (TPR) repeat protein